MGETTTATIKDVARAAGVSVATVSRVINNLGVVRKSTEDRVRKAIEETNYIPNAAATGLKTNSSKMIGFLISNIMNPHFTIMAKVIERTLRQRGYSLIVSSTDDDPAKEIHMLQCLQGLNVDGIILNTTGCNDEFVADLSTRIPMVLVDRSIRCPELIGDFVGSNGFDGVRALTEHLISRGHTRIGIITSNLSTSTGRERLEGFSAAMRSIGVTVDEKYPLRYSGEHFNEDDGASGCNYLMNLPEPPTAIVVANNAMVIGAYKYLNLRRIAVPDDVSIVSFGNINNSDLFRVQPTFATLNPSFIGEKAADLLLSRMEQPARGNREVFFEPLLVQGESTRSIH